MRWNDVTCSTIFELIAIPEKGMSSFMQVVARCIGAEIGIRPGRGTREGNAVRWVETRIPPTMLATTNGMASAIAILLFKVNMRALLLLCLAVSLPGPATSLQNSMASAVWPQTPHLGDVEPGPYLRDKAVLAVVAK